MLFQNVRHRKRYKFALGLVGRVFFLALSSPRAVENQRELCPAISESAAPIPSAVKGVVLLVDVCKSTYICMFTRQQVLDKVCRVVTVTVGRVSFVQARASIFA